MNSVITDEQKNIIANLANKDGLIKGSTLTMIGIGVGLVVWAIIEEKRK